MIEVSENEDYYIIKRKLTSNRDIMMYTPRYFKLQGFDAEISILGEKKMDSSENTEEKVLGGERKDPYKSIEEVSVPFRYFVNMIRNGITIYPKYLNGNSTLNESVFSVKKSELETKMDTNQESNQESKEESDSFYKTIEKSGKDFFSFLNRFNSNTDTSSISDSNNTDTNMDSNGYIIIKIKKKKKEVKNDKEGIMSIEDYLKKKEGKERTIEEDELGKDYEINYMIERRKENGLEGKEYIIDGEIVIV